MVLKLYVKYDAETGETKEYTRDLFMFIDKILDKLNQNGYAIRFFPIDKNDTDMMMDLKGKGCDCFPALLADVKPITKNEPIKTYLKSLLNQAPTYRRKNDEEHMNDFMQKGIVSSYYEEENEETEDEDDDASKSLFSKAQQMAERRKQSSGNNENSAEQSVNRIKKKRKEKKAKSTEERQNEQQQRPSREIKTDDPSVILRGMSIRNKGEQSNDDKLLAKFYEGRTATYGGD